MTSLRHVRRKQCQGKYRHPNQQSAHGHLTKLRRQAGERGFINVYHCRFCGGWHVGHFKQGERY